MKKILVTGDKFTGSMEVLYGDNLADGGGAPLLVVDLRGAAMSDLQKQYVVSCVPVRYGAGFEQNWGPMTGKVKFATGDVELDFEQDFWWPFDNPINKKRCLKAWDNLSKADRHLCVGGLAGYLRHLSRCQWKSKMNPETWFKNRCWETNWDNVKE